MQLQRVIEDTSVVGCPCGACHGSGTYVARNIMGDPISLMECEACGGTGTANKDLQHQVLADLGQRKLAQPGYAEPNGLSYGVGIVEQYAVDTKLVEQLSNQVKG